MGRKRDRRVDDPWTPVSRGKTYCSPACGCGCTRAAFERAIRDADHLVERLEGSGWAAEVWENVGWHFRAVSGPVQVYGDRLGEGRKLRYTCLISDSPSGSGGSGIWTDKVPRLSYDDPNEAVEVSFKAALLTTSVVVRSLYAAYRASGGTAGGLAPLATALVSKLVGELVGEGGGR